MNMKKSFVFLLFLLTGIALGALLSSLVGNIPFLKWLNLGETVGIGYPNPITLDLSVIKFSFGFQLDINIIKMISLIACLWMYKNFSKGL